jgi:hypothetical protein
MEIQLHHWDYDKEERIEDGTVSTAQIAQCVTEEGLVELFDDLLNYGGRGYKVGLVVGKAFHHKHPTIQRSAIAFCLGFILRMADTPWADGRNQTAVETAKKIQALADNGELPLGPYL